MGRKRKLVNKETDAEECCFYCKDGGLLRVCDYKDCIKTYHPQCVGRDDSFLNIEDHWDCGWHSCSICRKTVKFRCLCCPMAVCGHCFCNAGLVVVIGKQGFCQHCLTLAGHIEGIIDPSAIKENIDFSDQGTYEFLFKVYWEAIKRKEGLTSNHICVTLEKESDDPTWYASSGVNDIELSASDSDDDDWNNSKGVKKKKSRSGKKKIEQFSAGKSRSRQMEFIGWGSRALFYFLAAIGKETTQELSQHDVSLIISRYCVEHNLFQPDKKKKVLCDTNLQLLLGRKSINKNSIFKLLNKHFAENSKLSEDEFEYNSDNEDENVLTGTGYKTPRNSHTDKKAHRDEVTQTRQRSCFASIVTENIKAVYLKRSLVEELAIQAEKHANRIVGSFVRVKSDPNDYSQSNPYQLLQVAGVKHTSTPGQTNSEFLLKFCFVPKDIPIFELSDDDFREAITFHMNTQDLKKHSNEECEGLRRRVNDGLVSRLTVVELEQKAKSLHDIITRHWITKELTRLENLVSWANEKGRRRELEIYLGKLLLLRTETEQTRLLNEAPNIIPHEEEVIPASRGLSKEDEQGSDVSLNCVATEKSKLPLRGGSEHELHLSLENATEATKNVSSFREERNKYVHDKGQHHQKECNPEMLLRTTLAPDGKSQHNDAIHETQAHPNTAFSIEDIQSDAKVRKTGQMKTALTSEVAKNILHEEKVMLAYRDLPREDEQGSSKSRNSVAIENSEFPQREELFIYTGHSEPEPHLSSDNVTESTKGLGISVEKRNTYYHEWNHHQKEPNPETLPRPPLHLHPKSQQSSAIQERQYPGTAVSSKYQGKRLDADVGKTGHLKAASSIELIEISDDEEQVGSSPSEENVQTASIIYCISESLESDIWFCESEQGFRRGPYSLSVLKEWSDNNSDALRFKVWKIGQTPEEARSVADFFQLVFLSK